MAGACLFAHLRGCQFIVEQPGSSVLFDYRPWRMLFERLRPWIITTHLGAFGAPTPKLTKLAGTAPWLPELKRSLQPADKARMCADPVSTVVKSRDGRVSGSKALKGTQSYPLEFGAAIAVEFARAPASAADCAFAAPAAPAAASAAKDGDDELWHEDRAWFLRDIFLGKNLFDDHGEAEAGVPLH